MRQISTGDGRDDAAEGGNSVKCRQSEVVCVDLALGEAYTQVDSNADDGHGSENNLLLVRNALSVFATKVVREERSEGSVHG